jgi:nucleotide-binding universal stress UspA family protein
MHTVLVAIDQTDAAERVVGFVNEFFDPDDVHVVGINVAPMPSPWVPPAMGWGGLYSWGYVNRYAVDGIDIDESRHTGEASAERTVRESGLRDAEAIGDVGDPIAAITSAAEELDVDVIVVGSDDRSFLERMLSRSVTKDLVSHSDRPVLVVP